MYHQAISPRDQHTSSSLYRRHKAYGTCSSQIGLRKIALKMHWLVEAHERLENPSGKDGI